jgi:DNA-binding MarR family transcriptional regulator
MGEDGVAAATRWLTTREQRAWRAYLDMNNRLSARLNRELQDYAGLSIADFSVLVQLSEHLDARMRVLELARALRWEKSRLSHQLSRMQQRGLVERSNCSEDRRGAFIVLTERGRAAVEMAAPRHVESVRRYLFDILGADEVDALEAIARAVTDRLDAGGDAECSGIADGAGDCAEAAPDLEAACSEQAAATVSRG